MTRTDDGWQAIVWGLPQGVRLALKLLLVEVVCSLSTEIGFANKVPPHNIAALWPTGAILFAVLVVAPVRHWWAYIFAAYFTSVITDARAGFPISAVLFVVAGVMQALIAAAGVRLFAGGVVASTASVTSSPTSQLQLSSLR